MRWFFYTYCIFQNYFQYEKGLCVCFFVFLFFFLGGGVFFLRARIQRDISLGEIFPGGYFSWNIVQQIRRRINTTLANIYEEGFLRKQAKTFSLHTYLKILSRRFQFSLNTFLKLKFHVFDIFYNVIVFKIIH